jgi:hypothetical protein
MITSIIVPHHYQWVDLPTPTEEQLLASEASAVTVLAQNAVGWGTFILSDAFTACTLGRGTAFDADQISAINNVRRKVLSDASHHGPPKHAKAGSIVLPAFAPSGKLSTRSRRSQWSRCQRGGHQPELPQASSEAR